MQTQSITARKDGAETQGAENISALERCYREQAEAREAIKREGATVPNLLWLGDWACEERLIGEGR